MAVTNASSHCVYTHGQMNNFTSGASSLNRSVSEWYSFPRYHKQKSLHKEKIYRFAQNNLACWRADKKTIQNTRELVLTPSASALLYPWQLCAISWSLGRRVWRWRALPAPTWKMPIEDDWLAPVMHWKFNQMNNCWTLLLNTQILYHYHGLFLLLSKVLPNLFPNIKPNPSKLDIIFNSSTSLIIIIIIIIIIIEGEISSLSSTT